MVITKNMNNNGNFKALARIPKKITFERLLTKLLIELMMAQLTTNRNEIFKNSQPM